MYFVISLLLLHPAAGALRCSEDVCLPANYSKLQPPADTQNKVGVAFDIDEVLKIEDSTTSITFSLFLNVEWNDRRLILDRKFGRGSKKGLVPVSADYVQDLWLPNIFIYNLRSFHVMDVFGRVSGLWIDGDKGTPFRCFGFD